MKKFTQRKKTILLSIIIQLFILPNYIMANNIPQLINYQGVITDASGNTYNGQKTITFNIYDGSQANASIVWGPQTFQNVNIVNGRFNVILGEIDENQPARKIIDAFGGEKRFIGIKVDGKEIFPRQQVLTTPFSINTQHSNESDHAKQSDHAGIADKALHHSNVIPVGTITSHFGSEAPQGWLICDGSSIPDGSQYDQLREVLGEGGKLPDLRNLFQKDSLMNIKGKFEYSEDLCDDGEIFSDFKSISSYTQTVDTRIILRGDANYAFDNNYNTSLYEFCLFECDNKRWIAYKFNKPKKVHFVSIQKCDDYRNGYVEDNYGLFSVTSFYLSFKASYYSTNGNDGNWDSLSYNCSFSPAKYPYHGCFNYDCFIDNTESYNWYKIFFDNSFARNDDLVEIEMKEKLTSKDFSVNYIIKY